jgi:AraC-like DNA-binding protein
MPKMVQFTHQPVSDIEALDKYFGCPVIFGAETSAIVFPKERMDVPNKLGDESIWRFFSGHLAEQFPEPGHEHWDRQVRMRVAEMLSDGVPSLNDVADQLGLGSRTLQRRLSDVGKSYQSLVEEVRRELALQLVAVPRYSFSEIAFLTGFSEQSSFTRAFKRWSGETPRAYRTANAPSNVYSEGSAYGALSTQARSNSPNRQV